MSDADDVMMHLLHALYTELSSRERTELAIAVLCERLGQTEKTLQRHVTELEEHGLITVHANAGDVATVTLTEQGWALFEMPDA